MDKTISIRIITNELPDIVQGACIKNGEDSYILVLNGADEDPATVGAFLHEMLHIYHGDHESGLPVAEIEAARHKEIIDILDMLNTG